MRNRTRKTALGAAALLVVAVAVALVAWQTQGGCPDDGAPASFEAKDIGASGSGPDEPPGGQSKEEWPGQSLGYVGPNGEGAVSGDIVGDDEGYGRALEALDGGWENRIELEFSEDAPGGDRPYAKGVLNVGFYKTCSEYDAHAIVAERGGVWARDSYVFANDLDWASALVFFPQCDSFGELSEMAEDLRGLSEVKFVDFETEIPDDDLQIAGGTQSVEQAYLYYAKFDRAWSVVECDHDVTIAIIDRDFDLDHPDLAGNILFAWDASTGAILQTDRVSGIGHGTAVAGVAGAVAGNQFGIDGLSGNAWLLLVARDDALGNTGSNYVQAALLYLLGLQDKPDVVNMSFGEYVYRSDFQAIITNLHDNYDVVFVASAGNDASSAPHYPSGYEGVISVASIDITGVQSSFSNTESSIDMCAVGEGIYTTVNPHARIDNLYCSAYFQRQDPSNGTWEYEPIQGTSFAAPQVAAAAALLKAQDPSRSAEDVEELLLGSAVHPGDFVDADGDGKDDLGRYGYGALDAAAAVGWTAPGGSPDTGGSLAEMYAEARR